MATACGTKTAVPELQTGDIEMRYCRGRGRRQDEKRCGEQAITRTNVTCLVLPAQWRHLARLFLAPLPTTYLSHLQFQSECNFLQIKSAMTFLPLCQSNNSKLFRWNAWHGVVIFFIKSKVEA